MRLPFIPEFGTSMRTPLPPWTTVVWQLAAMLLCYDALFYWGHRLLHHPYLYKRFHKQHHEFVWTVSYAAEVRCCFPIFREGIRSHWAHSTACDLACAVFLAGGSGHNQRHTTLHFISALRIACLGDPPLSGSLTCSGGFRGNTHCRNLDLCDATLSPSHATASSELGNAGNPLGL